MPSRSPTTSFSPGDVALVAIVSVAWGAAYIFIRQGILLGASPLLFAAARYGLTAGVFFVTALAVRARLPPRRAGLLSIAIGGPLMFALYGGLLYWGEQFTTGGYAAVLASTFPLLTVALGYSLLPQEKLTVGGLAGILLGFGGVAVLVLPEALSQSVGTWQGIAFVLGAMGSGALGTVLLRKYGGGKQGLWQIGGQFAFGAGLLGGAVLALPIPEVLPGTASVWTSLGLLVGVSSVLGYFAYFTLHHRAGPVRANVVAYLVPVVGVVLGTGLYGEPFTLWEPLGLGIVLVGVSLVIWAPGRPGQAPPPTPSSDP